MTESNPFRRLGFSSQELQESLLLFRKVRIPFAVFKPSPEPSRRGWKMRLARIEERARKYLRCN